MTSHERVTATLLHNQPDRTPYSIDFTQDARARMVEYCGGEDFMELIDNDICRVAAGSGPMECWIDETTHQDQFGVQWDRSVDKDIGIVCNHVLPERDLSGLELPDPCAPEKFDGFADRVEQCRAAGKFVSFPVDFSFFERLRKPVQANG